MHVGYMLTQGGLFPIPKSWLLLDTCSTCDVSNNLDLVTHIRGCLPNEMLTAYCNGGAQRYEELANLRLFTLTVHFKNNSMATILSIKSFSAIPGAHLTMDRRVNNISTLTLKDGRGFEFSQYKNRLYYFDKNNPVSNSKPKPELHDYSLLSTVSENKTYFSAQEIKGADLSRKFQEYLFFLGPIMFKNYVNKNLISNCEITADGINRGELIYGPHL